MNEVKEKLRDLMNKGLINLIIGYGEKNIPIIDDSTLSSIGPVFLTKMDEIDQLVWNRHCVQNLTVYLTKEEYNKYGKIAVFVKPCDLKSIHVLCQENQIDYKNLFIIGLTCSGVMTKKMGLDENYMPDKCILCLERNKGSAACKSGEVDLVSESTQEGEQPPENPETSAALKRLRDISPEDRWKFWQSQFKKCLRCYACRSVCPMCYCKQCICDMSQPQWIYRSPHLKGNFLFHIVRAYHLAGRCVGCGECERVCPMGIPLTLMNTHMIDIVNELYNYESGKKTADAPLLSQFSVDDDQSFIK